MMRDNYFKCLNYIESEKSVQRIIGLCDIEIQYIQSLLNDGIGWVYDDHLVFWMQMVAITDVIRSRKILILIQFIKLNTVELVLRRFQFRKCWHEI